MATIKELLTLPLLYKRGKKDAVADWSMSVIEEDGKVFIKAVSGQVDGKKQIFLKEVSEGKNLGRKNETTPQEQGMLIAKALWLKKMDKGYSTEITGEIQTLYTIPMAAQSYMEYRHTIENWPYLAQYKLNGVRCVARRMDNGDIRLTTKNGKDFVGFDHIRNDLKVIMRIGEEFDGELYRHTMPLEDIVSIVRRTVNPDYERMPLIQYHVFDVVDTKKNFAERLQYLKDLKKQQNIFIVDAVSVYSEEEAEEFVKEVIELGYEGLILRNPLGLYLPNYRSADLLKFKLFLDAEFEIISGREGEGKFKGACIFRCKTADDKEFDVAPEGSMERKRKYLDDLPGLIGKFLTVRYQTLTKRGVPEFPVGVEIRDYE